MLPTDAQNHGACHVPLDFRTPINITPQLMPQQHVQKDITKCLSTEMLATCASHPSTFLVHSEGGRTSPAHSKGAIFPWMRGVGSAAIRAFSWKSSTRRHSSEATMALNCMTRANPCSRYGWKRQRRLTNSSRAVVSSTAQMCAVPAHAFIVMSERSFIVLVTGSLAMQMNGLCAMVRNTRSQGLVCDGEFWELRSVAGGAAACKAAHQG